MKNDELYIYYIRYLDEKLQMGKISKGHFYLYKICEDAFILFKNKFKSDTTFARDKKIDSLLNDRNG